LIGSREQHLRVWIFFQDDRERVQQNFDAFFTGEARRHADDRFALFGAVRVGKGGNSLRRGNRQFDGRQDGGQFGFVAREERRVISVVLGVGHDMTRESSRHVVLKIQHKIDKPVERSHRKLHIAVICQHGRLAEQARAEGNTGRVELRKMQLHDIVLGDKFGRNQPKSGRENALADPRRNGHADHMHAIHHLFTRQGRVVVRGHHSHLMSAFDKGAHEALGVNGQSAGVRTVIGEYGQDFHKAGGL